MRPRPHWVALPRVDRASRVDADIKVPVEAPGAVDFRLVDLSASALGKPTSFLKASTMASRQIVRSGFLSLYPHRPKATLRLPQLPLSSHRSWYYQPSAGVIRSQGWRPGALQEFPGLRLACLANALVRLGCMLLTRDANPFKKLELKLRTSYASPSVLACSDMTPQGCMRASGDLVHTAVTELESLVAIEVERRRVSADGACRDYTLLACEFESHDVSGFLVKVCSVIDVEIDIGASYIAYA